MKEFSWAPLKNYFVCAEVLPDNVSGLLFHVSDDREFATLRFWERFPAAFFTEKVRPFRFLPPVIVAVHPSLVYTGVVPVSIERGNAAAPLGPIELENHISQLLTKNFNRERKDASKSLAVAELDAVLVQSRLFRFMVGDNEVLDPVGVHAKRLRATLEATFTTRSVFEAWQPFFNSPGEFYFVDANRARAMSLGKVFDPPYGLLTPDQNFTHYYFSYRKFRKEGARQGTFPWGTSSLTAPLQKHWGISRAAAFALLAEYAESGVSPVVAGRMDGLLKAARESFSRNVRRLRLKGAITLHAVSPALVCGRDAKSGPFGLQEPPLLPLLRKLGFSLTEKASLSRSRLFDFVAYYLEFYYDKSNSAVNRWLKRRVHWLSPSGA